MPISSSFVPPAQSQSWHWGGNLATGTHNAIWRPRRKIRITHLDAILRTAPATQAVLIDLNSFDLTSGAEASILASQADRISISAAARGDLKTLAVPLLVAAATAIVPEIDQVGSGTVGANLTFTIRYEEDLT